MYDSFLLWFQSTISNKDHQYSHNDDDDNDKRVFLNCVLQMMIYIIIIIIDVGSYKIKMF